MTLTGKRLEFPSPPRRKRPFGAWPAFERRLAETLGALEEDQYLVVSAKSGWAYVQFAAQGSYGLRAECMSNNYLDEVHALKAGQIARLERMGWSAPTGTLEEIKKKRRKGGSPNFFRDFVRPVPCADAARMAVRALTEVFAVAHPGALEYKAFDRKHRAILIPTLGLKREEPAPVAEKVRKETVAGLRKLVLKAIREASGNPDLELDAEGDVAVRFGSAAVYVRVFENPLGIGVFSPLLRDVEVDDVLVGRINALNADVLFARLFARDETVYAVGEVFTAPFVAEHVARTCLQVGRIAENLDKKLQKEFGGRKAFEETLEGAVQ